MRLKYIIIGGLLLITGLGLLGYYEFYYKNNSLAGEMFREAKIIQEREDKHSVNRAIDLYAKLIAKYPDSKYTGPAYFFIGACYEKIGLYRSAFIKYTYLIKDKNIKLDEEMSREVQARMARLKVQQNFSEEGISQLYSILESTTDQEFRSRIYSEIGHSYLKVGNVQKADDAFDLAIREKSDNEEAILGKARTLRKMGKSLESLSIYEQFLRDHGEWSPYRGDVNRAYQNQSYDSALSNYRTGNYWTAIKIFNNILKKYPNGKVSENSLYWLGESYLSLKNYNSALTYFGKVLSNNYYHKDEEARIKRGYIYFILKKYDISAKEFQVYLNYYPTGKYAKQAQKWKDSSITEITTLIENQTKPDIKNAIEDESEEYDENNENSDELEPNPEPDTKDKSGGSEENSSETKSSQGDKQSDDSDTNKDVYGKYNKDTVDDLEDVTEL